jgi:hypothetical protein
MEFKEAMRVIKRICTARDNCGKCVLELNCPFATVPSDHDYDKAEAILAKWAEEHPEKTIADDFFEKHPNALKISSSGIPVTCAKFCGYCKHCVRDEEASNCEKCWSQPLEE